jgi:hypothetical protein
VATLAMVIMLSSCLAIAGIFKAGFVGIIAVVFVIAIIIRVISMSRSNI